MKDKEDKELDNLIGGLTQSASNKAINNNFQPYIDHKGDDGYFLKAPDGRKQHIHTVILGEGQDDFHDCGRWTDEAVDTLNPDVIDSEYFWKVATDHFPLFSICGGGCDAEGNVVIHDTDDVNVATFKMHVSGGAVQVLEQVFKENPEAKMLEIGPGYGNIAGYVAGQFSEADYHAIDVNPLFNHPKLIKCDGRSIPLGIPRGLDVVYSYNVFQHLGREQRSGYYQAAYDHLDAGGVFVFGMFIRTPENASNKRLWGCKDVHGQLYTIFFKQLTPVDDLADLVAELEEIGFRVQNLTPNQDENHHYLTLKCTKPYED